MKILIISDVHANHVALEAVLADAGEFDELWNLGDTVGYGPKPRECVDRMIELNAGPILAGNHDLACVGVIDDCNFNPVARAASRWTASQLELDHRSFLKRLPSITGKDSFLLAHGSPRDPIWEYLTDSSATAENFECFEGDVCFVGHTHVPMVARLAVGATIPDVDHLAPDHVVELGGARFIINPGSVGQPRDRDPPAAYAILDTDTGTVVSRRVEYDVSLTQEQMESANLPRPLIRRLSAGR